MKDYIEERAVEVAYYIIETRATVRQAAKKIWDKQEYGAYGSNNIERFVWVIE